MSREQEILDKLQEILVTLQEISGSLYDVDTIARRLGAIIEILEKR